MSASSSRAPVTPPRAPPVIRPTSRPPAPSASSRALSLGARPRPSARAVEPPQSSGGKSAKSSVSAAYPEAEGPSSDSRLVVDFPAGAFGDISSEKEVEAADVSPEARQSITGQQSSSGTSQRVLTKRFLIFLAGFLGR